jgi:hypothetical protein
MAAQAALRGEPQERPDEAKQLDLAECMRANGVPDFPDPTGITFSLGNLSPNNPTLQNAAKVCDHKTGVQILSTSQPGMIEPDVLAGTDG